MPVDDPRFSSVRFEKARASELDDSARAARMEYLKPLAMLAAGFLAIALWPAMSALSEGGLADGALVLGGYALLIVASVIFGLPALILTCRLFGCDAGPLGLVAVRLAGIFSLVVLVQFLLGVAGIMGLVVTLFITGGLFAMFFEMDVREGFFCAFFTWLTWVVVIAVLSGMIR